MTTTIYTASKTRSNRPGWSVTFNHPRRTDSRGKFGLKVRRGLGTPEDAKADQMVGQLNEILADPSWWSLDRRAEASQRFDPIVVSAFFDGIEIGKINSKERREEMLSLPTPDNGYARVMLVGSTGAGKTTLLRQLIGSDHTRDRFPSTSTAKTTTADIEIITTATGPFKSVITFMNEHNVRAAVDECLEEACSIAVRGGDDEGIAGALLEHPEQRFRLSYPLGTWQQESPNHEMDSLFEDEEAPAVTLPDDEVVADSELTKNNEHLREYVVRIREVATAVQELIAPRSGNYCDMDSATRREEWIEEFTYALHDNQGFTDIAVDIMESIEERFGLIDEGDFEREATEWPTLWYYEERDRTAFLRQVRWFTGNHSQQFGRLLTPLVDGIRVSGPFQPAATKLQDSDRRLVLLDGEGLGHAAREATSHLHQGHRQIPRGGHDPADRQRSVAHAGCSPRTPALSRHRRPRAQARCCLHALRPSTRRQSRQLHAEGQSRSRLNRQRPGRDAGCAGGTGDGNTEASTGQPQLLSWRVE